MHTASTAADSLTPEGPCAPETSEPPSPGAADHPVPAAPEDHAPRFSRALLALTAAATIAASPLATDAFGPAGSGQGAHSIPVYLISRISHDVGHNDWAFQGQDANRVNWVVSYVALGLFWLVIALWMRAFGKRTAVVESSGAGSATKRRPRRLWMRVLVASWSVD